MQRIFSRYNEWAMTDECQPNCRESILRELDLHKKLLLDGFSKNEEEHKDICKALTAVKIDETVLKIMSSFWGACSGALAALGTAVATLLIKK